MATIDPLDEDEEFDWHRSTEFMTERLVFSMLILHLERALPDFSGRSLREACLSAAEQMHRQTTEPPWLAAFTDRVRRETILGMIPQSCDDEDPEPPLEGGPAGPPSSEE